MPKIPTYTSQGRITAESPSIVGGVTIDPKQNIATAIAPLTATLTDFYVKEKKQEAANKSTKILSDLYINQEDGTKGLYSIQSETSANPNPGEASLNYDNDIEKLWNHTKNTKLQKLDNFTKKALENKFYSTAGLFKIKSLEGSRNKQISETRKITEDFVLKDSLALKLNGIEYLDAFTNNIVEAVNKKYVTQTGKPLDEGIKKSDIQSYLKFGQIQLANDLSANQPEFFKENINKFNALTTEEKINLISNSDKVIKERKFEYLLSDLKTIQDKTSLDIINDFDSLKNGTFNGDVNKINLFKSLNDTDKKQLIDTAEKQRRESNAEINNINTAIKNEFRDESIQNSVRVYDSYKSKGIIDKSIINELFGDYTDDINSSVKTQFIELATKQGNDELKKISNYYKNNEITFKILEGEIKDIGTPFILQGENKPLSILQRAGDGLNLDVDLKFYIDYLLPNAKDSTFVEDNKKFFNFIKKYQPQIEGATYSKYIDKNLDNRLNIFKNDMFQKFISERKNGKPTNDLLNKNNKNFIGKNISSYLPTQAEIEKGVLKNFDEQSEKKYPSKLPNETKDQYLKRIGLS